MLLKIIFDTSFLLEALKVKKDPFVTVAEMADERGELLLPSPVLGELKSLAAAKGKRGLLAKIALKAVEKSGAKVEETAAGKSDDAIVEMAKKHGPATIVCSNDYELRRSLKKTARLICMTGDGRISWC